MCVPCCNFDCVGNVMTFLVTVVVYAHSDGHLAKLQRAVVVNNADCAYDARRTAEVHVETLYANVRGVVTLECKRLQ